MTLTTINKILQYIWTEYNSSIYKHKNTFPLVINFE